MTTLNTHGLRPMPQPQFKLFEVGQYQLLAALGPNDDGDGYGIRYTVPLDIPGLPAPSIWLGVNPKDGGEASEKAQATWNDVFAEIDQARADRAVQMVLDFVAPLLAGTEAGR